MPACPERRPRRSSTAHLRRSRGPCAPRRSSAPRSSRIDKREAQCGSRQAGGEFAQVILVERERRLAVEFVEDVAGGSRDAALGAESVPAALRARADLERAAEGHGDDMAERPACLRPAPRSARTGRRRQRDRPRWSCPRQRVLQPADEVGAVDRQSFGQDEDEARPPARALAESGSRRSGIDGRSRWQSRRWIVRCVRTGRRRRRASRRRRRTMDFARAGAADDGASRGRRRPARRAPRVVDVVGRAERDDERTRRSRALSGAGPTSRRRGGG